MLFCITVSEVFHIVRYCKQRSVLIASSIGVDYNDMNTWRILRHTLDTMSILRIYMYTSIDLLASSRRLKARFTQYTKPSYYIQSYNKHAPKLCCKNKQCYIYLEYRILGSIAKYCRAMLLHMLQ